MDHGSREHNPRIKIVTIRCDKAQRHPRYWPDHAGDQRRGRHAEIAPTPIEPSLAEPFGVERSSGADGYKRGEQP